MSSRRLLTVFWVWMAVLLCLYLVFPHATVVSWGAIGLSSVGAVIVGIVRNRPRRVLPWLLLAAALALLTAGDAVFFLETQVLGRPDTFPSLNDLLYLSMYPLLTAALLLLPRSTAPRGRGGVVDALILSTGIALLAWIFIIGPELHNSHSTSIHLAAIAYPVFDLLFLAAAARLFTEMRRTPTVLLMAAGGIALLTADVLYSLDQFTPAWRGLGGVTDIIWVIFFTSWGSAALHPSMRELTEPRVATDVEFAAPRLAMLTVAALIAPVVLVLQPIRGSKTDSIPVAILSAILFLLVLIRFAGVVRNYRQAVGRERSLREAGGALVSATDVDTVKRVVLATADRLFPPGARHEVDLPLKHETLDDESLDSSYRDSAVHAPPPTRFIRTEAIQSADLAKHKQHELAFVVPLVVTNRAVGDPLIGTLVVAAEDRYLAELQSPLEVLAAQAALAVDRITLNAEVARRDSERYFRTLVQSTADLILIVDNDNSIRYASPSATTIFGPQQVAGRAVTELVVPNQRPMAERVMERIRAGANPPGYGHWTVPRADGRMAEVEVSFRDLREEPTVNGLVFTVRDATEQLRLERELKYLAFHDPLTGLPNRVRFGDLVQQAVLGARDTQDVVGVLFVDVDDFKVVNDTMGHDVGDTMLEEVGRRLSSVVGHGELAARLGGDEFAILVDHARSVSDVESVAERVVEALAAPVVVNGSVLNASASIGIATTADAKVKGDLLRQADLALYVAKDSGKGRWRRYQAALHTAMVERLQLRQALDRAVAHGDFALAYQPIVDLAAGRPSGFEALLRWDDPERGLVSPGAFIDVAEDSGLIVPIGNWALRQAIADAAAWSKGDHDAPYLSINISVRQFRSPGLIDLILSELESSQLPPNRLLLEITESLLLRDDERVWSELARLRQLGIRVGIDDFGTGYSSLSYLRQVAVDLLKIDKSFIDTMGVSRKQRALVETIVRLAKTLGLDVVAEGIEREDDRALLRDMGCPHGQGFLFAAPMPFAEAMRWLHSAPHDSARHDSARHDSARHAEPTRLD